MGQDVPESELPVGCGLEPLRWYGPSGKAERTFLKNFTGISAVASLMAKEVAP